jgi:ABC-type Fe3+/spermidine/putrescine transport system ATPase subunit
MTYVTHDQAEALSLSDEVLVMDQGRVVGRGTPVEVYRRPAAPFVAEFLGAQSRLEARALPDGGLEVQGLGRLAGVAAPAGAATAVVCIRPGDVALVTPGTAPDVPEGVVEGVLYLGEVVEYRVRVGNVTLLARAPAEPRMLASGERVGVRIDASRALVFAADGGAAERRA